MLRRSLFCDCTPPVLLRPNSYSVRFPNSATPLSLTILHRHPTYRYIPVALLSPHPYSATPPPPPTPPPAPSYSAYPICFNSIRRASIFPLHPPKPGTSPDVMQAAFPVPPLSGTPDRHTQTNTQQRCLSGCMSVRSCVYVCSRVCLCFPCFRSFVCVCVYVHVCVQVCLLVWGVFSYAGMIGGSNTKPI